MGDLDAIKIAQREAVVHAGTVWMNHVIGQAQQLAPIEEGTLRGTGNVEVHDVGAGVEIIGSFSTPYAARQHEELDWKHPRGGQAKYLEEPFKRELPRLEPLLQAAAAKAVAE